MGAELISFNFTIAIPVQDMAAGALNFQACVTKNPRDSLADAGAKCKTKQGKGSVRFELTLAISEEEARRRQ